MLGTEEDFRRLAQDADNTEELESRPGIVGYFVQQGDTLWNLAKKYNTTVENIKEVNYMEKEGINKGDKILIFKQNLGIL